MRRPEAYGDLPTVQGYLGSSGSRLKKKKRGYEHGLGRSRVQKGWEVYMSFKETVALPFIFYFPILRKMTVRDTICNLSF